MYNSDFVDFIYYFWNRDLFVVEMNVSGMTVSIGSLECFYIHLDLRSLRGIREFALYRSLGLGYGGFTVAVIGILHAIRGVATNQISFYIVNHILDVLRY